MKHILPARYLKDYATNFAFQKHAGAYAALRAKIVMDAKYGRDWWRAHSAQIDAELAEIEKKLEAVE